ncbi:MAG: SDR family NAD(P)-dependent oxidoreductase [Chloroflexota bacterium]
MQKTILITGATDGIGLETAKMLVSSGHNVLIHGRNPAKLKDVSALLAEMGSAQSIESYVADLSSFRDVEDLAQALLDRHSHLDVLINNAGVFKVVNPITKDGFDVRFVVNTLAPYLLTKRLLPIMNHESRVINLSSAAQAPVNIAALSGQKHLPDDFSAYAQSKLAITMWSTAMSQLENSPVVIAVNPGSLLKTNMVAEAFGRFNNDVSVGADILVQAALSDGFANASGKYFDNDSGNFASPHPDGLNQQKINSVTQAIEDVLSHFSG